MGRYAWCCFSCYGAFNTITFRWTGISSSQSHFLYYVYCYPGDLGFPGSYTSMDDPESEPGCSTQCHSGTGTGNDHSEKNCESLLFNCWKKNRQEDRKQNEHLDNLFTKLQLDVNFFSQDLKELTNSSGNSKSDFQHIYLELLERQRQLLY